MNATGKLRMAGAALTLMTLASMPVNAMQQITRVGWSLLNSGFEPVRTLDGWLDEDETDTYTITLRGGVEYAFAGDCDDDCTDLDLELRNSDGVVMAKDTGSNASPALRFTPRATGSYRLKVTMYRCDVEPCKYAVEQYRR